MANEIKGLKKITDMLDKLGKNTELKLRKVLKAGANEIQHRARNNLVEKAFNNGDLANSIIKTSQFKKDELAVEIGPTKKYGPYIEFGTKPHFPPTGPLKRWAEQKGFDNPWLAAHMIALKISHHGTKPKPYLIPAYNKIAPKVFILAENVIKGMD